MRGVRGPGTAPGPARPRGRLPRPGVALRYAELSQGHWAGLGRETRGHGGLRACLTLSPGRESGLGCLRQGCLGGQVLIPWDVMQEGQQGQEMPRPWPLCWQGAEQGLGVHNKGVQS